LEWQGWSLTLTRCGLSYMKLIVLYIIVTMCVIACKFIGCHEVQRWPCIFWCTYCTVNHYKRKYCVLLCYLLDTNSGTFFRMTDGFCLFTLNSVHLFQVSVQLLMSFKDTLMLKNQFKYITMTVWSFGRVTEIGWMVR
jgi:hypothetical protein